MASRATGDFITMSSELRVDKIVPVDGVPTGGGGGIIQIIEVGHSTEHSISAVSPQQIFSGSITPKFSTSKIKLDLNIFVTHENYYSGYIGIFKGSSSTAIQWDGANNHNNSTLLIREGSFEDQSSDFHCHAHHFSFLDTAGTTSAITYNIKGYTNNSGYITYVNRAQSRGQDNANFPLLRSTLTLTEYSA